MKRIPELRDLSDDHHTGLVLARRCRQSGAGDGPAPEEMWEEVLEAFAGHLEPHFRIEEDHLLPALEEIGEGERAARIREDHASLRALRDAEMRDREGLARFGELLEAHIRYEEREVFEPTQERLPARALEAIAAACRTIPRVCPTGSA